MHIFSFQNHIISPQKCARLCMAINHQSLTYWPKNYIVSNFLDLFSPAGCLASWRGGQAAPQRMCVTCLQRWTPSSLLWLLSTSSTKLCWDLSCTDERAGFICSVRNIHAIFDIIIFLMLCFSCVRPLCLAVWVFPWIQPWWSVNL